VTTRNSTFAYFDFGSTGKQFLGCVRAGQHPQRGFHRSQAMQPCTRQVLRSLRSATCVNSSSIPYPSTWPAAMSSNNPTRRASSSSKENGVNSIEASMPAPAPVQRLYGPGARNAATAARGPRDASPVALSTTKRVTFQQDAEVSRLLKEQQTTIDELKDRVATCERRRGIDQLRLAELERSVVKLEEQRETQSQRMADLEKSAEEDRRVNNKRMADLARQRHTDQERLIARLKDMLEEERERHALGTATLTRRQPYTNLCFEPSDPRRALGMQWRTEMPRDAPYPVPVCAPGRSMPPPRHREPSRVTAGIRDDANDGSGANPDQASRKRQREETEDDGDRNRDASKSAQGGPVEDREDSPDSTATHKPMR
jgi:hypothetical protein